MSTPWRTQLYKALSNVTLTGECIDLGGSRKSGYHELLQGDHTIKVANIDDAYGFDIKLDLEKEFPVADESYNGVLAINTLEHIYDHELFLAESFRIMKQGGLLVIAVPFLIQIHPCPHDHWRYTAETLEKIVKKAGFSAVNIVPIGTGPSAAAAQIMYNMLGIAPLRFVSRIFAQAGDAILALIKGKNKLAAEYPLGYLVTARKN